LSTDRSVLVSVEVFRASGQIWGILSGVIRYHVIAMQMAWRGTDLYCMRSTVGAITPTSEQRASIRGSWN
jgi:hypothetical protein